MADRNVNDLALEAGADAPASSCVVYPMPQPDIMDKLGAFVLGVAIGIASMAVAIAVADKLKGA